MPLPAAAIDQSIGDAAPSRAGVTLFVVASGSIPGFKGEELTDYLATQMTELNLPQRQFAAAPEGPKPENRVEWRFTLRPDASGSIRMGGIVQSLRALLGRGYIVSIEARLYLGNTYQTLSFATATVKGGPQDGELSATIAKLTRSLLKNAGET